MQVLAGETRFEHATSGFGDRCSTVEPLPYDAKYFNILYPFRQMNNRNKNQKIYQILYSKQKGDKTFRRLIFLV